MGGRRMRRASGFGHRVRVAAVAAVASLALAGCDVPKVPELPEYAKPQKIAWLDQSWTPQERQQYHHADQGTASLAIPYAWLLALERPEFSILETGLLRDDDYLRRFGFIPSPRSGDNPDGLPIGFTRTRATDPNTAKPLDQPGLTCAACHTGQLDYQGNAILIDGGAAMIDLGRFRLAIALSVGLTEKLYFRFGRFAKRVLGPDHSDEQARQLKAQLTAFIELAEKMKTLEAELSAGMPEEGFGRLDALNRIGNEVFGTQMGIPENQAKRSAPVAYPHIWDTGWFDWVQYNGSIQQPMVRNAGEAMGVRAWVNFKGGAQPLFTSTVPVDKLYRIEESLMGTPPLSGRKFNGLSSPRWPEHILPAVDRQLAKEGEALYARCTGCHLPPVTSEEFWRGPGTPGSVWSEPGEAGTSFLKVRMVPIAVVGTDYAQAADMKNRTVLVPAALGLVREREIVGDKRRYGYGDALGQTVEKVVNRWYDSRNPPTSDAERKRLNGFRPNGIRDEVEFPNGKKMIAYKARPLNGVWATPPFLHNGSVPTLYDLLSPLAERPKTFWLGNREFDPVKVGYRTDEFKGGFLFNTALRGNWNGGHLFEDPTPGKARKPGTIGLGLSPRQRQALIEYLKTL